MSSTINITITWVVAPKDEDKIKLNKQYLTSIPSFLKIAEFIFLLVSLGLVADLVDQVTDTWKELEFLLGITVTSWIIIIILFGFGIFNILTVLKMRLKGCILFIGCLHMCLAFILLISAGMSLKDAKTLNSLSTLSRFSDNCTFLDKYKTSAAFAILSSFILIVDQVLHLVSWARDVYQTPISSEATYESPVEGKHSNPTIDDLKYQNS